ncbi:MAG: restriction endonuclease, partial [Candidatus Heimdallarchaeota archaeon]|nr:restriction endonuclease [Candidatus Heimdallarchaeota archaeon]
RGLVIDQNTSRASNRRWDFVIQNGADNEGIGITIKDWRRAVGVDIIIRAEKLMKSSRFVTKVLLISNHFSDPARSLAERIGILLLTKNDIIDILSSESSAANYEDPPDNQNNVVVL